MPIGLKSVFHWKYSNWVIGLAGSAVLGTALADKFTLAYVFTLVACIFSIGGWLTSDTLVGKRSTGSALFGPNGQRLSTASKVSLPWRIVPTIFILLIFGACSYWIRGLQIDKELSALDGWLVPANDNVKSCPSMNADDLILMTGAGSGYTVPKFPHVVLAYDCDDIISIDRDVNGRGGITLTVFDKDGKVVVDLERGRFEVNRNNIFHINRHGSRSTLSVIDQYKREVLYLHLANKNVLQLRASVYDRGEQIVVDEAHPFGSGANGTFDNTCIGGYSVGPLVQIGTCIR